MIRQIQDFLIQNGIEAGEAQAEARLLVCEISNLSVEKILSGAEISNEIKEQIWLAAKKRAESGAPVQHILKSAYFMGDKFFVDENVLIPRPETELLVNCTINILRKMHTEYGKTEFSILDIGTGTGCIPIEISKNLPEFKMEIMGVDISTDALRVAIKNMEALGQQRRVIFRKSDVFSGLRPIDKFDIIVSNPPYIPISAKDTLQNEVKNFDPEIALFAQDKDGVEFYEKIITGAKKHLKPACSGEKRYVLFELGCTNKLLQSTLVSKIAEKEGFKIEFIEKDLSNIERVICLSL